MTHIEEMQESQRNVVINAARLVVATYPFLSDPLKGSDLDYYMAHLRDELAALDKDD